MNLANVLYIFPVKMISQQTEKGFLNHGRIEWFLFFSEVKASKTCQQTLTNIGAKEKFIQTEEKSNAVLSLVYSVSPHKAERQIAQCWISASYSRFITYLVSITAASTHPFCSQ